jgi:hypothetical protein
MKRIRRREGFSLIAVLIVSFCSMLMLGAVMGFNETFSGASRATRASDEAYNTLEREVERAKGALKMEMTSRPDRLRRANPTGGINSLSDLRVKLGGADFWKIEKNVKIGSRSGQLNVEIYDMLYDPALISSAVTDEERAEFPPAVQELNTSTPASGIPGAPGNPVPGGVTPGSPPGPPGASSAGVYLIRASITWSDAGERDRRIDVAVAQNANTLL